MMTDVQWDRLERILRKVTVEDRQQREKDKTFWESCAMSPTTQKVNEKLPHTLNLK